jgi:tRNA-Thr(GGU) m(6)t(6)A37 methyltransferase TsaA
VIPGIQARVTPHQPSDPDAQEGVIELIGGNNFEAALDDLLGFDRIWLIWWFDKNKTWNPKVLPPRGAKQKRGVFATRSPHRPNPIGITAVALKGIKGRRLMIGPCDLVDGTPILDIKPYLPLVDAFPEAKIGWLASVEDALRESPRFEVQLSKHAEKQLLWLAAEHEVRFFERARSILERDPSPHRTRRIVLMPSGESRMSCGAWRVFYTVSGQNVSVSRITCGYPMKSLLASATLEKPIPDQLAQIAFLKVWPDP